MNVFQTVCIYHAAVVNIDKMQVNINLNRSKET